MDVADGWLWIVGSHSVKRKSPKPRDVADAVGAVRGSFGLGSQARRQFRLGDAHAASQSVVGAIV